jgi:hypothetical protein
MTIHTPDDFRAMTEPDRLALFEDMGREAYGTQWKAAFARQSGWSRRTVHNWLARDSQMPIAALVHMQEYARRRTTPEMLMQAMGTLAKDLRLTSQNLNASLRDIKENLRADRALGEKLTEPVHDDDEPVLAIDAPDIDVSRL